MAKILPDTNLNSILKGEEADVEEGVIYNKIQKYNIKSVKKGMFFSIKNNLFHNLLNINLLNNDLSKDILNNTTKSISSTTSSINSNSSINKRYSNYSLKESIKYDQTSPNDILQLPTIRIDGPTESKLKQLISDDLYLNLNLCMGHPIYFPGDLNSNSTIPWPQYNLNHNSEIHYETNVTNEEELIIKSFSLSGIIHLLSCKGTTNNELLNEFLHVYHYFIKDEDLLRIIIIRYLNAILYVNENEEDEEWNSIIQLKLLNLIKKWVQQYHIRLSQSNNIKAFFNSFLNFIKNTEPKRTIFIDSILNLLFVNNNNHSLLQCKPSLNCLKFNSIFIHLKFGDLDLRVFTEQLTLMEHELFCKIRASELYHQIWNNKEKRDSLAPNLLKLIQMFNLMANFVTKEIYSCNNFNEQMELIQKFIKVAKYCYKLRNYNSSFEIITGLQMVLNDKDKKHWNSLSSKDKTNFKKLTLILSTKDNYRYYRELLFKQQNLSFPCLPFLGITLTDLVFTENGNFNYIHFNPSLNSPSPKIYYINYNKLKLISKIINQLLMFQNNTYNLTPDTHYKAFIMANIFQNDSNNISINNNSNITSTISSNDDSFLSSTTNSSLA